MCLEVGGVDPQPLRYTVGSGKSGEDAGEHAQTAPPDETILTRLMRRVAGWRVVSLQPVADHVGDAADHPAIIDPDEVARAQGERFDAAHLCTPQQHQITTPQICSEPPPR